ncbi:hypothetical protein ES288_A05G163600v1 [Gossypium darwinii]|uniref:Uncharacterized protein n=1 Tax=Gossypium darwinii TaxID=34276 RepID=A0A5D2GGJ5_GOSDA|nr:hypothetical protein ES288_A05G163600v1 [Gossypium darwinii]
MSNFQIFSYSSSNLPHLSPVKVQVVPKFVFDRLLEKFLDVEVPGRIFTKQDMLKRLKRVMDRRRSRRYNFFSMYGFIFSHCI